MRKNEVAILPSGIRAYIRDIELQTGRKLHPKQIELLKEDLRKNRYQKLSTPEDVEHHRRKFTKKVKNDLIAEWERQTGQTWPRYTENGYLLKMVLKPGFSRILGDYL